MENPFTLKNEAEKEALTFFDQNIRSLPKNDEGEVNRYSSALHNTDVDAFRHAYVSGIFTQKYGKHGEKIADWLGQLNEFEGTITGEPGSEKNMDLWNNKIGRKYGKKTQSGQELANSLKQALERGELIITPDQKIDSRKYIGAIPANIDPKKSVIVLEKNETNRNELFLDTLKGAFMTRSEFVKQIQTGQYPEYKVSTINGISTPMSKADHIKENNLG